MEELFFRVDLDIEKVRKIGKCILILVFRRFYL